jgi:hypothetical protein
MHGDESRNLETVLSWLLDQAFCILLGRQGVDRLALGPECKFGYHIFFFMNWLKSKIHFVSQWSFDRTTPWVI